MNNVVPLSIGPILLDLFCEDLALREGIKRRYSAFLRRAGIGYPLRISIQEATGDQNPIDYKISFAPSEIITRSGGCIGQISLDQGARLTVTTADSGVGIEYFLRVVTAVLAFEAGGLLFHAASILRNGKGYIFFGHSGSGKSTVSRLSSGDVVLNDDLLVLIPEEQGWCVYATPFWNPTQNSPTNDSAQVHSMYRLIKDSSVYLEEMTTAQAVGELVANTPILTADVNRLPEVLARCVRISQQVPVRWLHFLRDDTFWKVIDAT